MDVSNFVCCICQNVPDSVAESGCCHSLFCWDCVLKRGKGPCPSCDKILEPEYCNENVAIQKLIDKTATQCRFEGCGAWVTYSTMKAHAAACEYATVMCPNSELCGFLTRKGLAQHELEDCAYRTVRCHSCDDPTPLHRLQDHLDQACPGVIVECTNNCLAEGIVRSQLAKHMADECPNALVACPFSKYGCEELMTRCQMATHLRDAVSTHLLMTTTLVETQQREIGELREQVHALQDAPKLTSEQLLVEGKAIYNMALEYLDDFRPVAANFAAIARERLRWASLLWLVLIWVGLISVHPLMRWLALVFWFVKGYKVFVKPFRSHLASKSEWHVKIVNAVYLAYCLEVSLLVMVLC